MYLQGTTSGRRYRLLRSTLGVSEKEPTYLKLGQTVYFKLFFEPTGGETSLDLREEMKGGDWSFPGISIPAANGLTWAQIEGLNRERRQEILDYMSDGQFGMARVSLEAEGEAPKTEEYRRLGTVAAYKSGRKSEAMSHLMEAVQLNPKDSRYRADLASLCQELGKNEEALREIDEAIRLSDDYIEYRFQRGEILFEAGRWKESVEEYDRYEASGRGLNSYFHLRRGVAKAKGRVSSACKDLQRAKDLAETDREWEEMQREFKTYCGARRSRH
jgi:hypothetical protein